MSALAWFLVLKIGLMLGLIALAAREIAVARRPDSNPELTAKLLHTFSAAERSRARVPARPPLEVPPLVSEPEEAPRRAA